MNTPNPGRAFEGMLSRIWEEYERRGVMKVEKVEPPCRILGGGGPRRVIFLENPNLDYVGVWTGAGCRALQIEAKTTQSTRLALGAGGLSETQQRAMERWHGAGAVVFVLWLTEARLYLIPWQTIRDVGQLRRSLTPEHGIAVPAGRGWVLWDVEAVMQVIWGKREAKPVPTGPS